MTPLLYALNELKSISSPALYKIGQIYSDALAAYRTEESGLVDVAYAQADLLNRFLAYYEKPEYGIDSVHIAGIDYRIAPTNISQKPFCTLKHFKKIGFEHAQKSMLIIAPLSGHFATLLRGTISKCLEDYDVYVTDWHDAQHVPLKDGAFSLDQYVEYLLDFQRTSKFHSVLAVCQPAVPALLMVAMLSQRNESCLPTNLILMGGPIDTRINPGPVNNIAQEYDLDWFRSHVCAHVAPYHKGANRLVVPGFLMLNGFMNMNLNRHQEATFEYLEKLTVGDEESVVAHRKFYDEYRSVMDLSADYFLQSIDVVFMRHLLPKNDFYLHQEHVDLTTIKDVNLITIEGENDDITKPGQTYATHQILNGLKTKQKHHLLQKNVGHYGVFNGRKWRDMIYPFIHKHSC